MYYIFFTFYASINEATVKAKIKNNIPPASFKGFIFIVSFELDTYEVIMFLP
jgi:hypothetical protein